jgi:hypothetical protein
MTSGAIQSREPFGCFDFDDENDEDEDEDDEELAKSAVEVVLIVD